MKLKSVLTIALAVGLISAGAAFASVVPFSVSVSQGPDSTWNYTLTNNDTLSQFSPIVELELNWDEGKEVPFTVTGSPDGWIADDENTAPAWLQLGTEEPTPGNKLGGFVVTSATAPKNFKLYYADYSFQTFVTGCVTDETPPPPVPEPSSLATLLVGLSGFGAFAIRRRA